MNIFSAEELARYSRHIILPEFGLEGQKKLKDAKVLVIGTGGLGSPMLLYLAAAGVGTIGIVDFDIVDESNLQRQVLFQVKDVGQPKVVAAKARLEGLNPHIHIITHHCMLSSQNAMDILRDYDVIADGTDNFPTRYLVNDACALLNKPLVYGSIFQFDGQVSVFNFTDSNGAVGPNYRDLFPTPPPPGLVPSCAEGGVLGVLPGIIGSMQANEVIKIITGIGEPLSGRLLLFDALKFETRILKFSRDESNPINGTNPSIRHLIDYDEFCGITHKPDDTIRDVSVDELKRMIDARADFQLIDVREPFEYDLVHLDAELIPLKSIAEKIDKIVRNKPVVVYCKSGMRSAKAIRELQITFGLTNLYNLKGGIIEFINRIDPSMPKY
ncbi:molybdopterin-synthase adenylyltransferase MoeB [bacterium]|nr:molybdopterin-synthase adenylyltransferase MoeB [bacterium]